MTLQTLIPLLVAAAFSLLMVTLFVVKVWSDRAPAPSRKLQTVVTPARRPEPAAEASEAA